jgi:pyridinium-3,5-bisthiocarboxylic acid mononucleotide nickel chelatase
MTAQAIAYLMSELLSHGALDVFSQAVTMKKSRLGTLITVICHSDRLSECEAILWRETSTLGIRKRWQERKTLTRKIVWVDTIYGRAQVKIAQRADNRFTIQPEYEDCAQLARQHQLPLIEIQKIVEAAAKLFISAQIQLNFDRDR